MSPARSVSARLRRTTVIAVTGAIVAAGLLAPSSAYADSTPQTRTNVLGGTSLSADGWTGPGTDSANGYDFNEVAGSLQASNYKDNGDRGVITQLESPITAEAGEPGYTDAAYDSYHIAFTVDSALTGDAKYDAQPGLSVEVDADEAGNRAGGGLYLTVPADNMLELDNFSTTDPFGLLWTGATKQDIPFTGRVTIDYTVKFVAGGPDVVTVKANGVTVISTGAGSYEGYSFANAAYGYSQDSTPHADHQKVDQVLFRSTRSALNPLWSSSNTDPNVAPWATLPDAAPSTPGTGFLFSGLSYGAQNSSSQAYGFTTANPTAENQIANFEDSDPTSDTFNYTDWHIGSNTDATDPNRYFNVLSNGEVQLNDYDATDSHGVQLIKGIATADQPTDLYALVAQGLAWTNETSNLASFQIALTGNSIPGTSHFATLHPESDTETVGLNVVKLSDPWVATHAIGSIAANTVEPLGVLLAALEPGVAQNPDAASDYATTELNASNVQVTGFGVASEANAGQTTTKVGAIYFGGVKYTFSPSAAVAFANLSITGTRAVGHTLSASTTVDPADANLSYQWLRNGVAIHGAKGQTYTATSSDYGKNLSVKVIARVSGYTSVTSISNHTARIALGTITATGSVGISGDTKVGATLTRVKPAYDTTDLTGNDATGVTLGYQWYRGSSKISKATKTTYTLTPADLGAAITLQMTAKKTDYTPLPLTSPATAAIAHGTLAVAALPTITGTPKSGRTLTAASHGWSANGIATGSVIKRYFWFVSSGSGTPGLSDLVQAGTSSTLSLSWWATGLKVSVYVVGVKEGYTSATTPLSAFSSTIQ